MLEPSNTKPLQDLFRQYGLEGESDEVLRCLLIGRGTDDDYKTNEQVIGDWLALDSARMLKQLRKSKGRFTLTSMALAEQYENNNLMQKIEPALEGVLSERIEKKNLARNGKPIGDFMILSKGFGGFDTGRAFLIPYPSGVLPQQEGFSNEELQMIIDYEKPQKCWWQNRMGNRRSGVNTQLPVLGLEVEVIMGWLNDFIGDRWSDMHKHCFTFDYFLTIGMLDFKGKAWLDGKKDAQDLEKNREVLNWLNANNKVGL